MQIIECETPSETIRIIRPKCIGTFYIIYVEEFKARFLANCIDATPDGEPKRMRIQKCMFHGGEVVQPHEYEIIEEDVKWED